MNSPNSTNASGSPPKRSALLGTPTNVSEPAYEYLLSSILTWVENECHRQYQQLKSKKNPQANKENEKQTDLKDQSKGASKQDESMTQEKAEELVMIAENAAAKMERMGYDVGYRLSERLAQNKPMSSNTSGGKKATPAMIQLEAVKFICKEFWSEVFRKQVDKLQTNHRGVFVLKDLQFQWLKRLPADVEMARIMAIKILAFPCGLIRGALSNLGINTVVSCDFLADGKNMSACSFNIKVKSTT